MSQSRRRLREILVAIGRNLQRREQAGNLDRRSERN
jgi:hypothetical protein